MSSETSKFNPFYYEIKKILELENMKCKCGNETFIDGYMFFYNSEQNEIGWVEGLFCRECLSIFTEQQDKYDEIKNKYKKSFACTCGCEVYEEEFVVKNNKASLIPNRDKIIAMQQLSCIKCKKPIQSNDSNKDLGEKILINLFVEKNC